MGETLDALHRLQKIERKLAVIRHDREVRQRRIDTHRRQAVKTEDKLREILREVQTLQIKMDALSLEVAAKEEVSNKHREALNKAKTNKEYSAVLSALNTEKADSAKLESAILEWMEQIQTLKDEADQIETEKANHLERTDAAEQALREYDQSSKKQFDQLMTDRNRCADHIAPPTLASFTRVAEHLDGEAMAPVSKLHPKRDEYICSGCNMKITLEIVNALKSRDELQLCRYCGRILYVESSFSPS